MTAEEIAAAIHASLKAGKQVELRIAALDASKFLRSRLTEAAYSGECHHCDEAKPGEPCFWCGLVREGGPR